MITHIFSGSVGSIVPQFAALLAAFQARVTSELAARARVGGFVQVGLPSVAAVAKANAQVMAALSVRGPTVTFNATAQLALIAALKAQLALFAALLAAMGEAGVEVFIFDGPGSAAGTEIGGALSPGLPGGSPHEHINAFIAATRIPACWEALGKILLTS